MPWTWADGLLVGCLASVLWKARLLERVPAWLQWTSAVAVLAFVFYPNAKDAGFTYSIGLLLLALAGAVSILAAVNHPGRALSRALSWSWLRWFGTRSYSLYLWNANFLVPRKPYPIPRLLDIVIGVAVSLVLAELSFRYIETPALRLKRRFETRERRSIAGVSGTADPSAPPSPV
jgi:peptidoglycan/LPS O-acetylase OafA/YrhL